MQRHLGGNPWQRLHQEVGGAHPGFDCAERVHDRLASLAHLLRMLVEPTLHGFENVLMLPSGDVADRATAFDGTGATEIGPVAAQD